MSTMFFAFKQLLILEVMVAEHGENKIDRNNLGVVEVKCLFH